MKDHLPPPDPSPARGPGFQVDSFPLMGAISWASVFLMAQLGGTTLCAPCFLRLVGWTNCKVQCSKLCHGPCTEEGGGGHGDRGVKPGSEQGASSWPLLPLVLAFSLLLPCLPYNFTDGGSDSDDDHHSLCWAQWTLPQLPSVGAMSQSSQRTPSSGKDWALRSTNHRRGWHSIPMAPSHCHPGHG